MPVMNCPEFHSSLDRLVEQHTPLDRLSDALRQHADECAGCRTHWQSQVMLNGAIHHWRADTPEVDLTDLVLSRVAEEADGQSRTVSVEPPPKSRRTAWLMWPMVACLCVMCLGIGWLVANRTGADPNRTPQVAEEIAPVPTENEMASSSPSEPNTTDATGRELVAVVDDAGSAYQTLVNDTTETLGDFKLLVTAWVPSSSANAEAASVELPPAATESSWLDDLQDWEGVKQGLVPVGRDIRRPWEFLRDALPSTSNVL